MTVLCRSAVRDPSNGLFLDKKTAEIEDELEIEIENELSAYDEWQTLHHELSESSDDGDDT